MSGAYLYGFVEEGDKPRSLAPLLIPLQASRGSALPWLIPSTLMALSIREQGGCRGHAPWQPFSTPPGVVGPWLAGMDHMMLAPLLSTAPRHSSSPQSINGFESLIKMTLAVPEFQSFYFLIPLIAHLSHQMG